MFREQERTKLVDTDNLAAAPTNADEVKINVRKCSGSKDSYGDFTSMNTPISGASPKPFSSNMDSRSIFPTKTPSFFSSNVYPPISLKVTEPFGVHVKSKDITSSL